MKLSDKVLELLNRHNISVRYIILEDEIPVQFDFFIGLNRYTLYVDSDGYINLYGNYNTKTRLGRWLTDLYSIEEVTDEEMLFLKLNEPEMNWKTHSELLDMLEGLIK
jgi:hypothetical protein